MPRQKQNNRAGERTSAATDERDKQMSREEQLVSELLNEVMQDEDVQQAIQQSTSIRKPFTDIEKARGYHYALGFLMQVGGYGVIDLEDVLGVDACGIKVEHGIVAVIPAGKLGDPYEFCFSSGS
jgi:hypothetical protein